MLPCAPRPVLPVALPLLSLGLGERGAQSRRLGPPAAGQPWAGPQTRPLGPLQVQEGLPLGKRAAARDEARDGVLPSPSPPGTEGPLHSPSAPCVPAGLEVASPAVQQAGSVVGSGTQRPHREVSASCSHPVPLRGRGDVWRVAPHGAEGVRRSPCALLWAVGVGGVVARDGVHGGTGGLPACQGGRWAGAGSVDLHTSPEPGRWSHWERRPRAGPSKVPGSGQWLRGPGELEAAAGV